MDLLAGFLNKLRFEKNLLMRVQDHPFDPNEFQEDDLPLPLGAKNSTEEKKLEHEMDPRIIIWPPKQINDIDKDYSVPEYMFNRSKIGYPEQERDI